MPVVMAVVAVGIGAFLWTQHAREASAASVVEEARLDFYRTHQPDLATHLEGMAEDDRDDWERDALDRAAAAGLDDPRVEKLGEALRQELRTWRALLPTPCTAFDGDSWHVFVLREWHGLDAASRREVVEDVDRVVSALVGGEAAWVLRDAGAPVGGRRTDYGIWVGRFGASDVLAQE